ncbi:cysteine-rich motor neuron 1 protein-like isoform X2 [Oculina patagonica]
MLIGLLFIGSFLVTFSPAVSLSCIPCSWVRCTAPVDCKGGLVKSICGCCSVCAKVEGEGCGGQWQTLGRCDSGLKCVVRDGRLKAGAGTCEPAVCKGKKCGFREVCTLGNDGFPMCTCPQACNGYKHKPVCGYTNGKQYNNECELHKEECDSAKTIGVMAGPCKKCFDGTKTYLFGETRAGKNPCEQCTCFHGEWKCRTTDQCEPSKSRSCTVAVDTLGRTLQSDCPKGFWCKVQIPGIPEAGIPEVAVCTPGHPTNIEAASTVSPPTSQLQGKVPLQCLLPPSEGPCRAAFRRWYYNKEKGKCMVFSYGGCEGNANNFYTKPACKLVCMQRNTSSVQAVKQTHPPEIGNTNTPVSSLSTTSVYSLTSSTTVPVTSAVMFKCRCSNCSGQDRCATAVGCFTIINHTTGGARQTEKGCFATSEEYRIQCTRREDNKHKVECCKQDMCNDFTISDESNEQKQVKYPTTLPTKRPYIAKCHDSPSNKFYGEAESWEPNDCTVCVCRNGTPECLATVCRHPDCKEPLYIKGQCCPVCPLVDPSSSGHTEADLIKAFAENKLDTVLVSINHGQKQDVCRDIRSGQYYLVGQSWQLDQCTTCYCGKSGKAACAVQMCERDPQCKDLLRDNSQCCPKCGDENVVKSTSKCYDTVTEKYYREAEMWQRDECTSCYCGNDRKPECTETNCPPVFCEAPIKIKQRCCPVCPDTIQQGCMYDGQKFLHGDLKLLQDQCTLCKCDNGDWHCARDSCLGSEVHEDRRLS